MAPIVSLLGVADYGYYTFITAIVFLLSPFLSLNISAGIVREGTTDIRKANFIHNIISHRILLFVVFLIGLVILILQNNNYLNFIIITIALAATDSLTKLLFARFRTGEEHGKYFSLSFLKVLLQLIALYSLNYIGYLTLETLFVAQIIINFLLYVIFAFPLFASETKRINLKPVLIFSSLLLPHTAAQWAMSASNRIMIQSLLGEKALGFFSISFSIASVAMIINSGVAIVIPQHIIKKYNYWTDTKNLFKFYVLYSFIFLILFISLLTGIYLDNKYFQIIDYYDSDIIIYMTFIFSGFYFLGFYYVYSNILFYHRKSKQISGVTLLTSAIGVSVSFLLIYFFKVLGAAIGAFITYILYFVFIYFAAERQENKLKNGILRILALATISVITMFVISNFFIKFCF